MKIENCKFAGITSKIIITVMIFVLSAMPAHAKLVFTNDVFDNEAEIFRIGEGDDASGTDLSLQFGSTSTETLGWDSANSWFEVTDDFSLEGNEIKSVVLDNQSGAPGSPSAGQIYHNTSDDNTYVYNGSGWEDITQGTGFTENTSAAVQARRTTSQTLTTQNTWYDITFDATDVETDTSIIQHDDTNTEQIDIKEDGTYRITYHVMGTYSSGTHEIESRLLLNGTTPAPGSFLEERNSSTERVMGTGRIVTDLTGTNYVTLQARGTTSGSQVVEAHSVLTVEKLEGAQGAGSSADPDLAGVNPNTFTLDTDNTGGNVTFQFGTSLAETLTWDNTNSEFDLSDDLSVNGNISHYGTIFTLDADNTGSGANVDIVAEQGTDSNGTLRYNASANQWEISNDGGAFNSIAINGGTLDEAYDFGGAGAGRTIDVDSGAVELTVSDTDNNSALILNQNDTTNNPNTLEITNTGSGFGLLVDSGDGIFDEDVVVGGATSRTETIDNVSFSLGGDDLFVADDMGVEGNIYTDGSFMDSTGLIINNGYIRSTGDTSFQSNGDTNDYIYFDTTSNEEYIYFEDDSLAYTNDPGFRLNSTSGELEYRDEDESSWTRIDALGLTTETLDDGYNQGSSVTIDSGAVDLNGTGEVLEIGDGTANDAYINFDDGTNRQMGWDDSQTALSTFDQEFAFRVIQSATPPVTCGSTYSGMQWMDTDTGILYICDTSNSRNKWLSVDEFIIFGEASGSCSSGSDPTSDRDCGIMIGNALGADTGIDVGYFLPHNATITGYGFSEDSDGCSGTFDTGIAYSGSSSNDNSYTWLTEEFETGLSDEAHNANNLDVDIDGNQYIIPGIQSSCGGNIDDWNMIVYYRYRHD